MGFTFQTTPSVLVEAGGSARLGEILGRRGCRSVFLVTDRRIEAAGLTGLAHEGTAHTLFTDVVANPPDHVIPAAVAAACEDALAISGEAL